MKIWNVLRAASAAFFFVCTSAVAQTGGILSQGQVLGNYSATAGPAKATTALTFPVVSGNLACFSGTTGLLKDCGSSPTALSFGTGAASNITASSTNTGFANTFAVANSGTVSNGSTIATLSATLNAGSATAVNLTAFGGANPGATLLVGTGMTGGFNINTSGNPLSFVQNSFNPANSFSLSPGTGANGSGMGLTTLAQEGTQASPIATPFGLEISYFQAFAWDGTTFSQPIPNAWTWTATENWTPTAHGAAFQIQATPNGTTLGQSEAAFENGLVILNSDAIVEGKGYGTLWAQGGNAFLGTSGSIAGATIYSNATSGALTISPPTGALGTVTNTLQAASDTFVYRATTDTLTNKTINGASNTLTVRAASDITGTLPVAHGGTGSTTGAVVTVKKQVFTASGTYTPSTGMLYATIECVGSGGSGAGGTGPATGFFVGGGGGSGGYSRSYVSAATVGASQTVTVGAAGAAPAAGNTNGGAGGDVSVGTLCVGKGGSGGLSASTAQTGAGGAGGVAGTGDFTIAGNAGQSGIFAQVASVLLSSGAGASSYFGGGAAAVGQNGSGFTATGGAAGNYGGGGSGGNANTTTGTFAGGNGSKGVVVITEFCSQ